MLERGERSVKVHTFLVHVELEMGRPVDPIINRMSDGLTWLEGVGHVTISHEGIHEDTYQLVKKEDA